MRSDSAASTAEAIMGQEPKPKNKDMHESPPPLGPTGDLAGPGISAPKTARSPAAKNARTNEKRKVGGSKRQGGVRYSQDRTRGIGRQGARASRAAVY